MTTQRITRGFAWNHLYKIVEYGGVNLYAILVLRKFGPAVGGNNAVFLSISATLAIISAFAVDGVLLRYLPRILRGERVYGSFTVEGVRPFLIELFAFRMFVNLVLIALLIVVLAVLPIYVPSLQASLAGIRELWPYFAIFLFGQALVAFCSFTLIGLLQVKWVFFASTITRSALLAVGISLLYFNILTIDGAIALFAYAAVLNGVLLLYWVYRHVEHESKEGLRREFYRFQNRIGNYIRKPGSIRLFVVLPFMLYGLTTWGNDLLSTVLGRQPDILMMRAMLGQNSGEIGLYDAATRLGIMTEYILLFGLGGTLVSVFSELAHEDENNPIAAEGKRKTKFLYTRLRSARREIAGFQTVATGPAFAFMIVFSPLVLEAAYGPKFAAAQPILMASLIIQAITVILFGGGMHITSLVAIGKERVVFVNRLSWGALNLIVNYFLIPHFGGFGAIIGTQLSNAGVCATESILTSRWIGQSFRPARTVAILAVIVSSVTISWFVASLLPHSFPSILRLIVSALLMAILTLGSYALFRIPEAYTVFHKLRGLFGASDTAIVSAKI